jgi:hypothetical protein
MWVHSFKSISTVLIVEVEDPPPLGRHEEATNLLRRYPLAEDCGIYNNAIDVSVRGTDAFVKHSD